METVNECEVVYNTNCALCSLLITINININYLKSADQRYL